MNDVPSHERWEELAAGYALHALEPEDELAFLDHLAGCHQCAQEVARFERTAAQLSAGTRGDEQPPPGLWERIEAEIDRDRTAPPKTAPPPTAPPAIAPAGHPSGAEDRIPPPRAAARWWQRRELAVAAAVVLIAVALGVGSWRAVEHLGSGSPSAQALMNSCRADAGCRLVELTEQGHTQAVVLLRGDRAQLVDEGLQPLDSGYTYVLWQLPQHSPPTGLAAFTVDHSAPTRVASADLQVPAAETTAFAVSREPGHTIPSTPTTVVAAGALSS